MFVCYVLIDGKKFDMSTIFFERLLKQVCRNFFLCVVPRCGRRARLKPLGGKTYCSDCHDEVVRTSEDLDSASGASGSDSQDDNNNPPAILRNKRWV